MDLGNRAENRAPCSRRELREPVGSVPPDCGYRTMVHTSDLIDIASHHSTPVTISVNVGMSLNRQLILWSLTSLSKLSTTMAVFSESTFTLSQATRFCLQVQHPQNSHTLSRLKGRVGRCGVGAGCGHKVPVRSELSVLASVPGGVSLCPLCHQR